MQQHIAVNNLLASSIIAHLAMSTTRNQSHISFEYLCRPCPFSRVRIRLFLSALFGNYGELVASLERIRSIHRLQYQRLSLTHSICFPRRDPLSNATHCSSHSFIQFALGRLPIFDHLSTLKPYPSSLPYLAAIACPPPEIILIGPSVIDAFRPTSVACCLLVVFLRHRSCALRVCMPLVKFLSVRPFYLALHFRFHRTLANLPLSLRNHSSYLVTDNLGVRFKSPL